jgi:hypothetical protein
VLFVELGNGNRPGCHSKTKIDGVSLRSLVFIEIPKAAGGVMLARLTMRAKKPDLGSFGFLSRAVWYAYTRLREAGAAD